MLTKEEKYIIRCDTCGKEEVFDTYDAFDVLGNFYFNQSKFLDWENKKFCSKDCASKSETRQRREEIDSLVSPSERIKDEKLEKEKKEKEWKKGMDGQEPSLSRWQKAGCGGPNEYKLRIMSGSHIGRGLISYGMVGQPDNVMKIGDYDEHPPLIPEKWYSENPERAEWLKDAREKDAKEATKGGKII